MVGAAWQGRLIACALAAACSIAIAAEPPAIPDSLTPEQADALLAQLTDAQARQLLAQQLRANSEQRAKAEKSAAGGLGVWLVRLRKSLESSGENVARRRAVMAEGSALLPAALSSSVMKVSGEYGCHCSAGISFTPPAGPAQPFTVSPLWK